jgi:hypothetical protein
MSDVVAGHDRDPRRQAEKADGVVGRLPPAARGERELHAEFVQTLEQRDRASQGTDAREPSVQFLGVTPLHPLGTGSVDRASGLTGESLDEEAAAHADPAVDPPHGDLDLLLLQRLVPGENVLVDAVDEGAVNIEEQGRRGGGSVAHAVIIGDTSARTKARHRS